MVRRGTLVWGVVVVLLAGAAWFVTLGVEGLAYQRAWPTMSDGSTAYVQLALGAVLAAAAAVVLGVRALRARRDSEPHDTPG